MKKTICRLTLCTLTLCAASWALPVMAAWPDKPIRMVVPFAAGGPVDAVAREVANELTTMLGQSVIVDNLGGATGKIAISTVLRAAPDGYTILFGSSGVLLLQPLIEGKRPAPLVPVGMVSVSPMVLVVNDKLPVKTTSELIAYAKAHPGKVNFGSGGVGGIAHLGTEMLKNFAGINIVHVPYKGTGPLITDLVSDQIQGTISSYPAVKAFIDRGQFRVLGLTAPSKTIANVPLIKATVPEYEFTNWYGVAAPPATPPAIVERLNAALRKLAASPSFEKRMQGQGVELDAGTPAQMQDYIGREATRWKKVLTNVKIELN